MADLSQYRLKYELVRLIELDKRIREEFCTKEPVTIDSKFLEEIGGCTIGRQSKTEDPDIVVTERDTSTSRRQGRLFSFAGGIYYEDNKDVIHPAAIRDNKGDCYVSTPGIQIDIFPGDVGINNRAYVALGEGPRLSLQEIVQWPEYLNTIPVKIGSVPRHVLKLMLEPKQS